MNCFEHNFLNKKSDTNLIKVARPVSKLQAFVDLNQMSVNNNTIYFQIFWPE